MSDELKKFDKVFFFEEGIRVGGIGEQVGQMILDNGLKCEYVNTAVDDKFMAAATVESQFASCSLDVDSIIKTVKGE